MPPKSKKAATSPDAADAPFVDARCPVTVVTGFLGSGKTTLINHLLTANHGKKLAIIENEFGEVGIDDALIVVGQGEGEGEEILELNNGCVCCTVRGDLIRILNKLRQRRHRRGQRLDGVVIETTGLADPAPVAQTFFVDDDVAAHYRLDAIVTVADARHLALHLDDTKRAEGCENEAAEQLAFADVVLLNKRDLVTAEALASTRARIRAINAAAEIVETTRCAVGVEKILGIGAFELGRVLEAEPEFLSQDPGDHRHDDTVSSVGIEREGECDLARLNAWLSALLRNKGADIFRSKGVLAIRGSPHRHVFQGVHMLLSFGSSAESDPGREDTTGALRPWGEGEARECKLIFIGRGLDRAALERSFGECLVAAAGRPKTRASAAASAAA